MKRHRKYPTRAKELKNRILLIAILILSISSLMFGILVPAYGFEKTFIALGVMIILISFTEALRVILRALKQELRQVF